MENFGIFDDEGEDDGGADDAEEQEIEAHLNQAVKSQNDQDIGQTKDGAKQGQKKKKKKGNAGKPMDLSLLDEKSIKILAKLMLALMELNISLYDFFDECIYEQLVKTKTKQNVVEIINASEFFLKL